MTDAVPVSCRCGAVRGALRIVAADARRVRCHCDDCQAFARHLGRPDVLDAHGGTSIVQTSPAALSFDAGVEHLGCVQLREGGLVRWYASCCATPVANTMASVKAPFIGVIADCLPDRARLDGLGPESGVHGRFAPGGSAPDTHPSATVGLVLGWMPKLARFWWRGDAARSPFLDASGARRATPRVLTDAERAGAYDTEATAPTTASTGIPRQA